jgi:hypothetical protein
MEAEYFSETLVCNYPIGSNIIKMTVNFMFISARAQNSDINMRSFKTILSTDIDESCMETALDLKFHTL